MSPQVVTPDEGPTLSQAEAAAACGVSQTTIRRARTDGRIQGARRDDHGGWRIPRAALIAAGLLHDETAATVTPDRHPDEGDPSSQVVTPPSPLETDDLRAALAAAERRAERAEHRAELAEAVAEERGRALEVERALVLMLTHQRHGQDDPADEPSAGRQVVVTEPAAPTQERLRSRWRTWLRRRL